MTITPKHRALLDKLVKEGRYPSAAKIVEDCIDLLAVRERDRQETIKHLQREVQKGYDSIQRGDIVDGEEYMRGWARQDATVSRRTVKRKRSA